MPIDSSSPPTYHQQVQSFLLGEQSQSTRISTLLLLVITLHYLQSSPTVVQRTSSLPAPQTQLQLHFLRYPLTKEDGSEFLTALFQRMVALLRLIWEHLPVSIQPS